MSVRNIRKLLREERPRWDPADPSSRWLSSRLKMRGVYFCSDNHYKVIILHISPNITSYFPMIITASDKCALYPFNHRVKHNCKNLLYSLLYIILL